MHFLEVAAEIDVEERPAGRLTLDGGWPVGIAEEAGDAVVPPLTVSLRQTPVDHPLTDWLAARRLGPASVEQLRDLLTGGRFGLDATVSHVADGGSQVTGVIMPTRLRIRRGERTLVLREIEGEIGMGPGGAVAETLRGRLGEWAVTLQGVVEPLDGGGFAITGSLEAEGPAFDEDARALLPEGVVRIAEAVDLATEGPIRVSVPDLSLELAADGEVHSVAAAGTATLSAARVDVGVGLEEMDASIAFRYERSDPLGVPEFVVDLEAPSLRAGGLWLQNAVAEIVSTGEAGRVWIPSFHARAHDGRLVGNAMLDGPAAGADGPWRYSAVVRLSDVRLAPTLADLRAAEGGEPSEARGEDLPQRDASRGLLSGELTLGGVVGDVTSRRGRGAAQVGQGRVLDLPLLMPLVEVANLQLPSSAPVDLAMAEFFIEGERVTFEELSAFGGGVEIYGFGTLQLPQRELELRFASRAVRPIPVLGQIVEGLKNELVGLRVSGTLSDPDVVPETLRGTRAVLARLFGGSATADEQEMSRIERELSNRRERVRRASERMRRLAASTPESPAVDGD